MTAGLLEKAASRLSPGKGHVRSDRVLASARKSLAIPRDGAMNCPQEADVSCEECKRCDLGARE